MIKYKVKITLNGNITYKGKKLKQNDILDEYDIELLKLVEQKLVKVTKIEVDEIKEVFKEEKEKEKKKKKKKDSDEVSKLDN